MSYAARQAVNAVFLILLVITFNFIVLQGFFASQIGSENPWTREYMVQYGFCESVVPYRPFMDQCVPAPILQRYFVYLLNMATFNLGPSARTGRPVVLELTQVELSLGNFGPLWNTVALVSFATVVSVGLAIILGSVAAASPGRRSSKRLIAVPVGASSLPFFWVSLFFISVLIVRLGWFPFGVSTFWTIGKAPSLIEQLFPRSLAMLLPSITLIQFTLGRQVVTMRDSILRIKESLRNTRVAEGVTGAKPQSSWMTLKPALVPVVGAAPTIFAVILGCSFVTDVLFDWPGLGLWFFDYGLYRTTDFPLMQGILYLSALMVIAVWFVSRIAICFLKPREGYVDDQLSKEGWSTIA